MRFGSSVKHFPHIGFHSPTRDARIGNKHIGVMRNHRGHQFGVEIEGDKRFVSTAGGKKKEHNNHN